jgi:myo-inositol-1(or 4)-monophosphatase
MTEENSGEHLIRSVMSVVQDVITEIRPRLIEGAIRRSVHEDVNLRHPGNYLSEFDVYLHNRYRQLFSEVLDSFVYLSEEGDPTVVGNVSNLDEPDLCVLVDPLDTSELAVRALLGYTHVLIFSRKLARPVAAVVGDFFHEVQMFCAYRAEEGKNVAFATSREGKEWPLHVRPGKKLAASLVTNYSMRPAERFSMLARQTRLVERLSDAVDGRRNGRIGVDFGSIGLCHVAMGTTDAMVEFAKGFAAWDLLPGQYILEAAGGVVLDLLGNQINVVSGFQKSNELGVLMNKRIKFVAAADEFLAREIIESLDPSV